MTLAAIHKSVFTDIFTFVEPQVEAYRSNPVLFALLLYCFHNYLLPDVPYTPATELSCNDKWLIRCCNWLARYIGARPSLAEVDSKALQLTRLVKSRSQSEDLLYTPNLESANKLWLHPCISRLLPDGIYVPPDDELLKQSTILVLKILLREAEILSADSDRQDAPNRFRPPGTTELSLYSRFKWGRGLHSLHSYQTMDFYFVRIPLSFSRGCGSRRAHI
ncbi:hypothetical protein BJ165DRAFT_1446644 [Panaeolus papilionaceus]|nr:hypothetical protein BJ165DRAFT_1446644 [Panaeolus papilionaceus]